MTLDATNIAEAIHDGLFVSFQGFAPIRCERVSIHEDLSVTVWIPVVGEITPIRLEYRDQLLTADEAWQFRNDMDDECGEKFERARR